MSPGIALVPLRLFLGVTFVYAGIHKLAEAGFLRAGADTYIGDQLAVFAEGPPGGPLLETFALPQPELAGVGVALTEIAIGLLAVAGRFARASAAAGLGLSLVLFLTASWHTRPYFLGSDIVFAFAWLPFVLAGAAGQPALGLTAAATGTIAGVSVLARGAVPARAVAPGSADSAVRGRALRQDLAGVGTTERRVCSLWGNKPVTRPAARSIPLSPCRGSASP